MKLGELKSAVRSTKGNVSIMTTLPDGRSFAIGVMKASLFEEMDKLFENKASETGLMLNSAQCVVPVGTATVAPPKPVALLDLGAAAPLQIDLEDYIRAPAVLDLADL